MNDNKKEQNYFVVCNHEKQYSIWFADREVPKGWDTVGEARSKQACLDYIAETWVDMRPLSIR